ncbi:hypothetical protein LTR17_013390 [Elasticomyces elasticus]|nr:hypothetical protein LTR17_013390 [Elasticomyces elasticus]
MAPTTAPTPTGCDTKRSFSGTPLIGNSRMAALYKPTLVSIFVHEDSEEDQQGEYQVPRGLICASSEYFDKAFGEGFEEGKTGEITLPDTKIWVFECFIGWLYTQKVFWEHQDSRSLEQPMLDRFTTAKPAADYLDVADLLDPVTWKFEDLFDLYIFADKYDTRRLRTAVMTLIQTKLFQSKPMSYAGLIFSECTVAFDNVPDSSPLYKLLVDLMIYDMDPLDLTEHDNYQHLPLSVCSEILSRTAQLVRCLRCDECQQSALCNDSDTHPDVKSATPTYDTDFCKYHEHDSDEERRLCVRKWGQIKAERGIKG